MLNVAVTHFQAVVTPLNIPVFGNYRDKYQENRFCDRLGSHVADIYKTGVVCCGNKGPLLVAGI